MPAEEKKSKANASSHETTYSAANVESSEAPEPASQSSDDSLGLQLPSVITKPIEVSLGTVGRFVATATNLVGSRSEVATRRARPWLEFFDLSAIKPADGLSGYIDRLRRNCTYFVFNYLILGLGLSLLSVVTKPFAIIGCCLLIWVYFRFFGSETVSDEFNFIGITLDMYGKIGAMFLLSLFLFWLTAGGLQILISFVSASAVVAVIHGLVRKPHQETAVPDV